MKQDTNKILVDNNNKMKAMNETLGNTQQDVNQINIIMTDTNSMLVDQTGKF